MVTTEDIGLMRTCAAYNRRYHTHVDISLNDLIDGGEVQISWAACGSPHMQEIVYQVVDFKPSNVLVLAVSGEVKRVVDELSAWQLTQGE